MAKLIIVVIIFFSLIFLCDAQNQENTWFEKENVTKLHFFAHLLSSGPNANAYEVARASITSYSPSMFGEVWAVDGLLTAEPDYNSENMGRIQGLMTSADLKEFAVAMNVNFVFTRGEYNGSTISILGRYSIFNETSEFPVVGGTGIFRGAHGCGVITTYFYDTVAVNGILEFVLYIEKNERD